MDMFGNLKKVSKKDKDKKKKRKAQAFNLLGGQTKNTAKAVRKRQQMLDNI